MLHQKTLQLNFWWVFSNKKTPKEEDGRFMSHFLIYLEPTPYILMYFNTLFMYYYTIKLIIIEGAIIITPSI